MAETVIPKPITKGLLPGWFTCKYCGKKTRECKTKSLGYEIENVGTRKLSIHSGTYLEHDSFHALHLTPTVVRCRTFVHAWLQTFHTSLGLVVFQDCIMMCRKQMKKHNKESVRHLHTDILYRVNSKEQNHYFKGSIGTAQIKKRVLELCASDGKIKLQLTILFIHLRSMNSFCLGISAHMVFKCACIIENQIKSQ